MDYYVDYPKEPIGGGNPYYRCVDCKIAEPSINGQLDGHSSNCRWRLNKQRELAIGPQIFVLSYCIGTAYVWGCAVATPVLYESAEKLIVDLEKMLLSARNDCRSEVVIGGVELTVDDFVDDSGKLQLPDVYTVQEWYDSVKQG